MPEQTGGTHPEPDAARRGTTRGTPGRRTVLVDIPEVDMFTAPDLELLLLTDGQGASDLVADLGPVRFMDSAGVGVLVNTWKRQRRRGGSFAVAGCREPILRIITLCGLDELFSCCEATDDTHRPELHGMS